jgi:hypothetical protein
MGNHCQFRAVSDELTPVLPPFDFAKQSLKLESTSGNSQVRKRESFASIYSRAVRSCRGFRCYCRCCEQITRHVRIHDRFFDAFQRGRSVTSAALLITTY